MGWKGKFVALGTVGLVAPSLNATSASAQFDQEPEAQSQSGNPLLGPAELPSVVLQQGAEALQRAYKLSESDAALMLERINIARQWLVAQTSSEFADAAAGAWIEPESGFTIHVNVASSQAKKLLLASELPDWLQVHEVARSFTYLEQLGDIYRTILVKEVDARNGAVARGEVEGGGTQVDVRALHARVDNQSNSLEIDVPDDNPELAAALQSAWGQLDDAQKAAISFRGVPSTPAIEQASQACTGIDQCGSPLRGGIGITHTGGNDDGTCTAGFVFYSGTHKVLSTAAHCGNGTTEYPWRQRSVTIGQTWIAGAPHTPSDWQLIDIVNPNGTDVWKATNAVWKPHTAQWSITSLVSASTAIEGSPVCHTGLGIARASLGSETCGILHEASQQGTVMPGTGAMREVWSCGGDSGGAWEYGHTAYGMHYGVLKPAGSPNPNCYYTDGTNYSNNFIYTNKPNLSGYYLKISP